MFVRNSFFLGNEDLPCFQIKQVGSHRNLCSSADHTCPLLQFPLHFLPCQSSTDCVADIQVSIKNFKDNPCKNAPEGRQAELDHV